MEALEHKPPDQYLQLLPASKTFANIVAVPDNCSCVCFHMARRGFDDSSPVHATIPRAKMGTERLSHHGVHGMLGGSNVVRPCGTGLGQQQHVG